MNEIKCFRCHGSGKRVMNVIRTCPDCDGIGYTINETQNKVICVGCNGSFRQHHEEIIKCRDCNGSGRFRI